MNPTPPDANSPLATLRQLKDMLDAGAITQQEFEALKQRLIFGPDPAGAAPEPASSAPTYPAPPPEPAAAVPPTPYLDTPAALTPEATPLLTPEPDWLAAPAPPVPTPDEGEPAEYAENAEAVERRNPLNLIFALGGLLLFLAVVAYLVYERRPDEHMTSQSQTAADSAAVAPEVGPQAEQLVLPPAAAPETVRVAPAPQLAAPAPAIDSTTAMPGAPVAPAPAATAPAARPAPTTKPAARPAPTTAPAAADSTSHQ